MLLNRKISALLFLLFSLFQTTKAQISNKIVFGKVFVDSISNCTLDSGEKGLSFWKLRLIRPNNDTVFASTNSNGEYQIPKSVSGNYALEVLTENNYWLPCDAPKVFSTTQIVDNEINMAIKKAVICPKMKVNVVAPTLVKGQEANYFINYSNKGTADASSVYVDVTFDDFMSIVSSSLPSQNLGANRYRFQLNTVKVGEAATFSVKIKLQNNISTGLSHCVEAHIYPDNLCSPSPDFLASINGICNSGKTEFSLQRAVNQSISVYTKTNIIEDDLVLRTIKDTLNNGNIKNAQFPFQLGHVYTAQVTLPNGDVISKGVQSCNVLDTKGYLLQFAQEDGNPFTHSACRQNEGSIVSIVKTVIPTGRKSQHFIAQNEALEYSIHFQNVVLGDTVKNVSILDTLDKALDLSSLVLGASSHAYTWSLSGKGELMIQFNNIILPDSSKSKLASQGFVSFFIKQKKNNLIATIIHNKSSVKLGNQAKKVSNTVFHTIEKSTVVSNGVLTICEGEPTPILTKTFSFATYDSIVNYTLVVLPKKKTSINQTLCKGTAGTFISTFKAKNGCDSIVTTTVTIKMIEKTINATLCFGEKYSLGPKKFDKSGMYQIIDTTKAGCDSITTLKLVILPQPKSDTLSKIKCVDAKGPFTTSYNTFLSKTAIGCDSIFVVATVNTKSDTLKLAVNADKNGNFIYDGQTFKVKKDTIIYFEDSKNVKPCSYIKFSVKNFAIGVIDKEFENILLKIVPNPFTQFTKIKIDNSPFNVHEICLYDELGRLRRKEKFTGTEFLLEQNELEKGIFWIKISSDKWLIAVGKVAVF